MARSLDFSLRSATQWFLSRKHSERVLLIVTSICLVLTCCYLGISSLNEHLEETDRMLIVRKRHLQEVSDILKRYQTLRSRLDKVQATFAESQMTFEEVTKDLDKIVRDSIGSDLYELKKGRSPTSIGFEYEKQEFTLNIRALALNQVVKLLYQLEQGSSPLFLGKVDLLKTGKDDSFSATFEIFSIRKS